jgi:hypothetical protein
VLPDPAAERAFNVQGFDAKNGSVSDSLGADQQAPIFTYVVGATFSLLQRYGCCSDA